MAFVTTPLLISPSPTSARTTRVTYALPRPCLHPLRSSLFVSPISPPIPAVHVPIRPHYPLFTPPRSTASSAPSTDGIPTSFVGHLPENQTQKSNSQSPPSASFSPTSVFTQLEPAVEPPANALEMKAGWCFGRESVEKAIRDIAAGKFVVVVDDECRENEGDLILAADRATPEAIAFMVRYTSGVICCAMEGDDLDRLNLTQMVPHNTDPKKTAFTITCDLREGTSTGISASDRAKTLIALANNQSVAEDFHRPGHIFPLRYKDGGVLKRAGHTEASVDLARMAGCAPVGVLSEIVDDRDGSMARLPQLQDFVKEHSLTLTSIQDMVMYRRSREKLVERVGEVPARLPTKYGVFDTYAYRSVLDGVDHVALVAGGHDKTKDGPYTKPKFDGPVLVRVHSECCTGDVFGSLRCDCGPQLDFAMREIAAVGRGVFVYLRGQEGRGIGLAHKMRAYALQDKGRDTVQANEDLGLPVDSREYGIGAQILADLNVSEIILMTNNPAKYSGLGGYGLKIVDRMPVQITPNPENINYLNTKKQKMGHWLNIPTMVEEGKHTETNS